MNKKLIRWSITVALGGLLFGLDVANISGAEQRIQKLWNLSDLMHCTCMAMALYGTIFGAGFGSIPANIYGRKSSLIVVGIIFFVSALGSTLTNDVYIFMFFRFLGGLSVGASSVIAPVYISEIAPPQHRGKMTIAFQLNIVTGILLAYLFNYLLKDVGGENDWRYMLGLIAIPSLFFTILMFFTPESPRWLLLHKKDETTARNIFSQSGGNADAMIEDIKKTALKQTIKENLFSGKFNKPILLAFLLALFNQLSGINAIIYFAPRVFEMAGLGEESAFLSSTGIGIVNLLFTILGWYLIDRSGRKKLMYIGSVGYIISLALIALSFAKIINFNIPFLVFAFIAAHAIGQGSVIWVFLSEIFPNSVRASGTAFGCLTHWVFAALISQIFPFFANHPSIGGAKIFGFFATMMVLQLLFVWTMMPETKGISLEEMDRPIGH